MSKRKRFAGEVVALGFFFADGEQANAGLVDFENRARVDFAHHGELGQVVRLAVDVGAYIEQDAGIAGGTGHGGGQRGTVDTGQRAQHHFGGGHGSAGIAGSDEAGSLAFADQLEADAHGAVLLAADGVRGLLLHADALGGIVDDDGQVFVVEMLVEQVAQLGLRPHQVDAHGQAAAGEDGPANLRLRSFVGPYGVENDVDEHIG